MAKKLNDVIVEAIVAGSHGDPFSVLGMHKDVKDGSLCVRVFQPQAQKIVLLDKTGSELGEFKQIHNAGFFQIDLGKKEFFEYKLRVTYKDKHTQDVYDIYSFSPILGDLDVYLLAEGTHLELYDKLGAHFAEHQGVKGVRFAVWAPNAKRVSLVGTFNNWDGRVNPMRLRVGCGVWELFIPGLCEGDLYKFEIKGAHGELLPLKSDPFAFYSEKRPSTASVIYDIEKYKWKDTNWEETRKKINSHDYPMSVYEVHMGSWKRVTEEGQRYLTYRELADDLVPYVKDMGFTHIEFLPVAEHPFDGSWGYQVTGMFAPTSRYGTPEDFCYLVDKCHEAGIGVIIDWVPAHFPKDGHGLANFDGTALYEHSDPRQGEHKDWGTKIYNFGRTEVQNFLIASAIFWIRKYHIDALRVDAVASMLYLDYSREDGEWIPNEHGGNENLGAVAFIRRVNELIYGEDSGAVTIAEESTAWPMVSRPTYMGGLGFGYKWNMGWMHDTLDYIEKEPVHRKYHHNRLTFGPIYAFNENFVLSISHDEVVHGKGSLFNKMPGDRWQKFANMRAYYGFMFTHPGKKLLFMGSEFAQDREWCSDYSLSWHLLEDPMHQGVSNCLKDLNRVYKETTALYQKDFDGEGFEWIDYQDGDNSIVTYIRRGHDYNDYVVVACNFTPVPRENYQMGVPDLCFYEEVFNSDAKIYGGGDIGNAGGKMAIEEAWNYRPYSVKVTLPPLATVIFRPKK